MKKEEKAHFGQTIRTEGAADRSSDKRGQDTSILGRKMGGGVTDVSRSMDPRLHNDEGKAPGR